MNRGGVKFHLAVPEKASLLASNAMVRSILSNVFDKSGCTLSFEREAYDRVVLYGEVPVVDGMTADEIGETARKLANIVIAWWLLIIEATED